MSSPYCDSRIQPIRRATREVAVGSVVLGGNHPVRIQSMTTTNTLDLDATVKQTLDLAEAGCEIVRITAPNAQSAESLGQIAKRVRAAKVEVPLVADIHFMPSAAMEAVKHVEKVRVNPGNYADHKKFQVREYTDLQYEEELERLHCEFSPLVLRCKELGRSMRIGTNHGSLSDRIMNRFGDTPRGMAESALEFVRIAQGHNYHQLVLSMKASNPKVMIEAYRLVVSMMNEEGMDYPLHLGVTEAGDGEDARIKSAIGIGSLLLDGLGDTVRVSLTEDPIAEIPVARDLARRAAFWWESPINREDSMELAEGIDPYRFERRQTRSIELGKPRLSLGGNAPPAVIARSNHCLKDAAAIIQEVAKVQTKSRDAPMEGLLVSIHSSSDFTHLQTLADSLWGAVSFLVVEDHRVSDDQIPAIQGMLPIFWLAPSEFSDEAELARFLAYCDQANLRPIVSLPSGPVSSGVSALLECSSKPPVLTLGDSGSRNAVAAYRILAASLNDANVDLPIWIRNRDQDRLFPKDNLFSGRLLDSAVLSGSLLCDGLGDMISVENLDTMDLNRGLAYNLLQGARARITKAEFVACPSCGRTLFDLQSTTQKVKQATAHLKGVTIAVMGCIVNGPGEMADADFGYVGSGPGKINLYVGKQRVQSSIPEDEAVDRLINLIQEEGKWIDP